MFDVHYVSSFSRLLSTNAQPSGHFKTTNNRCALTGTFIYQQYCGYFNQGKYIISLVLTQKSTQPRHNIGKAILSKINLCGSSLTEKMCCLQLNLIFIFKLAATKTMQKVKMRHISVNSHHMKTNNSSTSRFSGTGNALVALFLSFKVKVTPWICQPPASENMPYLIDLS